MSIIKWSEELSTGIEHIDEQHRQLINIINELHLAAEYPTREAAVFPLIQKLHEYARTHFQEEEHLLEEQRFPGRLDHAKEHKEFIGRIDDLILRYRANNQRLTLHVRDFLLTWFFNHIRNNDMEYKRFLDQKRALQEKPTN